MCNLQSKTHFTSAGKKKTLASSEAKLTSLDFDSLVTTLARFEKGFLRVYIYRDENTQCKQEIDSLDSAVLRERADRVLLR